VVLETPRERLIALLAAAIVLLLGRAAVATAGAPDVVGRGLYLAALGCLLACVLVILDEQR
jgi:hypothetical protein